MVADIREEKKMLRKLLFAFAFVCAGLLAAPTESLAFRGGGHGGFHGGGGRGFHGGYHGGYRGGYRGGYAGRRVAYGAGYRRGYYGGAYRRGYYGGAYYRPGFYGAGYGGACWRWSPRLGRRIWVCQ
jgi:hypothetical protein